MNPLDHTGEVFALSLRNPNPRSRRSKEGAIYTVTFELDQEEYLWFMNARDTAGMVIECQAYVAGDGIPEQPPRESRKGPYGAQARELRLSNVLATNAFVRAIGPDAEYHEWVQRQPSCVSGRFSEYVHGEGRCEASHVRRAADAGTAFKPLYQQVPLTHEEHALQHQHGEAGMLSHVEGSSISGRAAAEFFDAQVQKHRATWAWGALKAQMGYESWSEVPPRSLVAWCRSRPDGERLVAMLPPCYRDA